MNKDAQALHLDEEFTQNLSMALVRVTEDTALAAGRWMGRGDNQGADQAATQAMWDALGSLHIDGTVVIGEETRLGAHTPLDSEMKVGRGDGPAMDVVLDPIDGVSLLSRSLPDAISVIGVAPRGAMWHPYPAVYMDKIIVDRETAPHLVSECMDAPAGWTLALVARVKQKPIRDLVVYVLKRARHEHLIEEIQAAGARVFLRSDGDVAGALMAASDRYNVDLMMGIGGVAEGVISACAVKALGGEMLGRLAPQSEEERQAVSEAGLDPDEILGCHQIIGGEEVFFSTTSITGGALMDGVHYHGPVGTTESMVLRSHRRSQRIISAEHLIEDLPPNSQA